MSEFLTNAFGLPIYVNKYLDDCYLVLNSGDKMQVLKIQLERETEAEALRAELKDRDRQILYMKAELAGDSKDGKKLEIELATVTRERDAWKQAAYIGTKDDMTEVELRRYVDELIKRFELDDMKGGGE